MSALDIESRILGSTPPPPAARPAQAAANTGGPSFDLLLQQAAVKAGGVKFSGHAQTRLASRHISLTESDLTKLGDAITRAAAKGARESLVLMDKAALVVSVPNRTVITAVGRDDLKENIFTNIDSALIL